MVAEMVCSVTAGRGSRIRTYDLQYPKLSRYQAAPYPEGGETLPPSKGQRTGEQGGRANFGRIGEPRPLPHDPPNSGG